MDINIERKTDTKREIEVTIPPEEMEQYKEKAAKKLGDEMNIKGFRPGNAPLSVVENSVGSEKLYEEAAREAIQETYPKIIEENDLFALSSPQVNIVKCAPGNEVVYKATVYVMPEIDLPDYKKIANDTVKNEKENVEVTEKEINDMIEKIRENKAKIQKVEREAKKGDSVIINFTGAFDDKEEKIEEKNFQITLGGGEMSVLGNFEDNLEGMKAGEMKTFPIDIPKSDDKGEFSGKKVTFDVEMVSVMEKELPEINDDLAKSFPEIETLEELKNKIKEGMKKDKEAKEKEKLKVKVLENIKKEVSFEVPEVLVEKELENMLNSVKNQLAQNNSSFETYLEEIGKTEENLKKEWRKKAEENVAYALLLHKISEKEGIEVSSDEIEEEMERHFSTTGRNKEEEKEENLEKMRAYIHDTLKNQKVFSLLSIEE